MNGVCQMSNSLTLESQLCYCYQRLAECVAAVYIPDVPWFIGASLPKERTLWKFQFYLLDHVSPFSTDFLSCSFCLDIFFVSSDFQGYVSIFVICIIYVTHPCLYILRWRHFILDHLHFLPQNVALAVVSDFLTSLQSEDEHDDQCSSHQEAEHHCDGLKWEINQSYKQNKPSGVD